ncbi:hypothetical protein ACO34A_29175 (plasmid) [Rhizobium sp. ACO-34A]|nr:hypothetical protein ACO34A_29175 [Rhizobium sp. ACO-34A]
MQEQAGLLSAGKWFDGPEDFQPAHRNEHFTLRNARLADIPLATMLSAGHCLDIVRRRAIAS